MRSWWGFLDRDGTLRRLDRIVGGIDELGLRSSMEAEVVRQLLRGRRTISEIVQLIFGQDPSSPGFHSAYVRVWRAVRELEAKGLVSAPLFGREKPYHLTGHGWGVILRISGDQRQASWRSYSSRDVVLVSMTVVAGAAAYVAPQIDALGVLFVSSWGAPASGFSRG